MLRPWLCQPDARQVLDLPESLITNSFKVSDLCYSRSQTCKRGRVFSASQRLAAHQSGKAANKTTDLSLVTASRFSYSDQSLIRPAFSFDIQALSPTRSGTYTLPTGEG